ncbi:MAG: NAD(P)-binding domain-containing protein [bacterium]
MKNYSVSFIGAGRITKIMLEGLKRKGITLENIIVYDIEKNQVKLLKENYPNIQIAQDLSECVTAEYIFIALHPPKIKEVLSVIKEGLNNNQIIIALAPKIKIKDFFEILGDDTKIVRTIPNAPSIINEGYNPISFSANLLADEKIKILEFMKIFGEAPEVEEAKLEAYAIVTAMGPTYFQFQIEKLKELGISFGLDEIEAQKGIKNMLIGAVNTLFSDIDKSTVMDLVAVKPIMESEQLIKDIYNKKLNEIFEKIR